MQMEQYENRKNYVESVKNSFASPGKKTYPEEQKKCQHKPKFSWTSVCAGTFSVFRFPWHASDRFFLAFLERRKDYTADPKFHQIPSDSGSIKPVTKA